MSEILPCPNCESEAEYLKDELQSDDGIYCKGCPLQISYNGKSYYELLSIWNSLPRRKPDHVWHCPDCGIDAKEYLKIDEYYVDHFNKVLKNLKPLNPE